MLIDLSQAIGSYLHDVFVAKFQWWVLLGYVAQILFTMRFLVQWIASERAGKMVMPIAFWFFSIGGGVLLFSYALFATRSSSWARDSASSSMGATSISSCATAAAPRPRCEKGPSSPRLQMLRLPQGRWLLCSWAVAAEGGGR